MFGNSRVLEAKLDAAMKLADERHDRVMKTLTHQHESQIAVLNGIRGDLKMLRETQLVARKTNGNGHAARAAASAAKKPLVAYPAGLGGGAGLLYFIQQILGG